MQPEIKELFLQNKELREQNATLKQLLTNLQACHVELSELQHMTAEHRDRWRALTLRYKLLVEKYENRVDEWA